MIETARIDEAIQSFCQQSMQEVSAYDANTIAASIDEVALRTTAVNEIDAVLEFSIWDGQSAFVSANATGYTPEKFRAWLRARGWTGGKVIFEKDLASGIVNRVIFKDYANNPSGDSIDSARSQEIIADRRAAAIDIQFNYRLDTAIVAAYTGQA